MMMMMMMVIILIIIKKKYSYMKHYNNTQPNLIIHYISHSIPSLPCIHTRAHMHTHIHNFASSVSLIINIDLKDFVYRIRGLHFSKTYGQYKQMSNC